MQLIFINTAFHPFAHKMSLQRTPPSGTVTSAGGSDSTPDLRTIQLEESFVTHRQRRKLPDLNSGIRADIANFRSEIMKFLTDFTEKQEKQSKKLSEKINEVKNDLKNIKYSSEKIVKDQQILNNEMSEIKSQNSALNKKVETLEKELNQFKNGEMSTNSNPLHLDCETVALEFQERAQRQFNIIIVGLPEMNSTNSAVRREHDNKQICTTIKSIYKECPTPTKCIRLGKHCPDKNRNLKVTFENKDVVINILRNKSKLISNSVRIFADQTPMQQQHMKKLRNELSQRTQNGELNLKIKYVNGVPKVIKSSSKNYKQ